ncbi:MAG: DNA repair protein RadC [Oscillospiraceae bacterium]|jgi:DNA repair protein RadC|nr:DNA repair protein RadC [Oscillospiraceae bacterium]
MHEDHRKRVRERFLTGGLAAFPPHNTLELLLFYAVPRRDTNELAHVLLNHFGSLAAVFDASFEDLCKIDGIGENAATLITMIPQLARRYLQESTQQKQYFDTRESIERYLLAQFLGMRNEIVLMLCLDNAGQLIHTAQVSLGTNHDVKLDNRSLLEAAFRYSAAKIILAHNHPMGVAAPSRNDIIRTETAVKLFQSVNIALLDHYIVAGQDCFSMAGHPKFGYMFLTSVHTLQQCADGD